MGKPSSKRFRRNTKRRMCSQCSAGMQRDGAMWFCEFCGYTTPHDDGFSEDALWSDELDPEDEALLAKVITSTDWEGS